MANKEIKQQAKAKGVKQWQIAERAGISEFTFCRKMRHEFTEDEQKEFLQIINEIAKEAAE